MGMGPWKAGVVSGASGVTGADAAALGSAGSGVGAGVRVAREPQAASNNITTARKAAQKSRLLAVIPLPGSLLSWRPMLSRNMKMFNFTDQTKRGRAITPAPRLKSVICPPLADRC